MGLTHDAQCGAHGLTVHESRGTTLSGGWVQGAHQIMPEWGGLLYPLAKELVETIEKPEVEWSVSVLACCAPWGVS